MTFLKWPKAFVFSTAAAALFSGIGAFGDCPVLAQQGGTKTVKPSAMTAPSKVSGKKQEKGGKKKASPRMMPAMAMIIPGVDPKANSELMKTTRQHSLAVRAEKGNEEELQKIFQKTYSAIDGLIEKHKDNKRQPRTVGFLLERKVRIHLQAIKMDLKNAKKDLDSYIEGLSKQDPKSDLVATAKGMRLYYTKLEKMEAGEEAESLIQSFLNSFPKKTWSGRIVFLYSMKVKKQNGDKARLQWLEKNLDKVSYSDASQIKRQLAYARLLGSDAELASTTVDGNDFNIEQLRGKVVLIDFWATWCGPCVREMPEIKEVYEEYHEKGFEVVSFSLDRSKEPLEKFLDKNEYPWIQLYLDDEDGRKAMAEKYGVTGIPATFLVDQKGKIVKLNLRGRKNVEKAVKSLLK